MAFEGLLAGIHGAFWSWVFPLTLPWALLGLLLLGLERCLRFRASPRTRALLLAGLPLRLLIPLGAFGGASLGVLDPSWDGSLAPATGATDLRLGPENPANSPWWATLPRLWFGGVLLFTVLGGLRLIRLERRLRSGSRPWPRGRYRARPKSTDLGSLALGSSGWGVPSVGIPEAGGAEAGAPTPWDTRTKLAEAPGERGFPRIRVTPHTDSPGVTGVLRPVIWLPEPWLAGARPRELELVLLHEWAHLRRRDPWLGALLATLAVFFWHHPITWLAMARWGTLREECCDDFVRRSLGGETAEYRATLCRFALGRSDTNSWDGNRRTSAEATGVRPTLGMSRSGSSLIARLRLLEDSPGPSRPRGSILVLGGVAFLLLQPAGLGSKAPAGDARTALSVTTERHPLDPPWTEDPRGCLELRHATLRALARSRGHLDPPETESPD